jgi:hypothetical protein
VKRSVIVRVLGSLLIGLLVAFFVSEGSFYFLKRDQDRQPATIVLVIPAGAAARVASGQNPPSIPNDLTLVVGDKLKVINQDAANHQLGPLFIPAGAAATMSFDVAQAYTVACSFRTSQYLGFTVQQPITIADRVAGVIFAGLPLGMLIALYVLFIPAAQARPRAAA